MTKLPTKQAKKRKKNKKGGAEGPVFCEKHEEGGVLLQLPRPSVERERESEREKERERG